MQPPCSGPGSRSSAGAPDDGQDDGRDQQRGQFDPVLDGLGEGDRPHAAGGHGDEHHDADQQAAGPARCPDLGRQRERGTLQLGHEVEPADQHHQQAGLRRTAVEPAGAGRSRAACTPRAAQRGGDESEQDQVAGGVADRVPQHVEAVGEHQPGDAEERRRGQVLAADRGRVPARGDRPRGDVEVAGGAGPAHAEAAARHGDDGDQRPRRRPPSWASIGSALVHQRGEGPLVALGQADGDVADPARAG